MRDTTKEVNGHKIEVFEECKNVEISEGVFKPMLMYRIYVDGSEIQVKKYDGNKTSALEFMHAIEAAEDAVVGMCQMFNTIK